MSRTLPSRAFQYACECAGVPAWALIGWLEDDYSNADQVARDYAIPYEAMEAAIAFYERHKAVIDARLILNRED
jgi:uncharacterized protein (DUF433 family)